MTVKTQDPELKLQQNLDARNKAVERSYYKIIEATKPLLAPFDGKKYRTFVMVDHTKSGKETKLISEFLCFFWNLTLTQNAAGCTSPLKDWTKFKKQFRTIKLGNHEKRKKIFHPR